MNINIGDAAWCDICNEFDGSYSVASVNNINICRQCLITIFWAMRKWDRKVKHPNLFPQMKRELEAEIKADKGKNGEEQ